MFNLYNLYIDPHTIKPKKMNYFTGTEPLILVSGKKTSFELVELKAGAEKKIEIKKNTRGFEFGLSLATGGGGTGESQTGYLATMFDAQEVANGKLIKVWREAGADKAIIVLTDGTEQQLINTRTFHYREADRINRKTKINWARDFFVAVAGVASTSVTAATGGQ